MCDSGGLRSTDSQLDDFRIRASSVHADELDAQLAGVAGLAPQRFALTKYVGVVAQPVRCGDVAKARGDHAGYWQRDIGPQRQERAVYVNETERVVDVAVAAALQYRELFNYGRLDQAVAGALKV